MTEVIRSAARGRSHYGWLDSRHTFSFAGYYAPDKKGVSVLRVINDDRVAPGAGFATHAHRDMEIISYVLAGALEHKDSMGNVTRINAGEFQVMTAGTGVSHSEYNPFDDAETRFLQIWIRPDRKGLEPAYRQAHFARRSGRQLIVSPDGRDASLLIHQDATLERLLLASGADEVLQPGPERTGFLHVVEGAVSLAEMQLQAGDAMVVDTRRAGQLMALQDAEALWFDLPYI